MIVAAAVAVSLAVVVLMAAPWLVESSHEEPVTPEPFMYVRLHSTARPYDWQQDPDLAKWRHATRPPTFASMPSGTAEAAAVGGQIVVLDA